MPRQRPTDTDADAAPKRIEFNPLLIASVCALEGAGKTEFGAGMPGPIEYFSIDPNTREVLEKHQDEKRIHLHEFTLPPPLLAYDDGDVKGIKDAARAQEQALFRGLMPILRREYRKPPSVVLDTGTEFFHLSLLADHGKTTQIWPPEARGVTNTRWKSLLRGLKDCGCNVVILHRLRDEYATKLVRVKGQGMVETREKTGEKEREGYNQLGYYVNVEAHLMFDPARDKAEGRFGMKIARCTARPFIVGREWWGEVEVDGETIRAASFGHLATQVYKRTKLKDWVR